MSDSSTHRAKRRFLPLVWAASAVSAAVLLLGVNGTLAGWSTAIITNSDNSVNTANAVILSETNGTATCLSSTSPTNTYTCTTINKYGGLTSPLNPGGTRQIDVTFSNVGKANAGTFKLDAAACGQTPAASAGSPGVPGVSNLCGPAANDLTLAVTCSDGGTFNASTPWTDLRYPTGSVAGLTSLTHTATLAPGSTWTCRFNLALSSNASVLSQGITVSQVLTWTLA